MFNIWHMLALSIVAGNFYVHEKRTTTCFPMSRAILQSNPIDIALLQSFACLFFRRMQYNTLLFICIFTFIGLIMVWHVKCSMNRVAINASPMRIAIPLSRNRITPLFDVAESFLLINPSQDEDSESILFISKICAAEKCLRLHEHGVGILLCGAVSRACSRHLSGLGIEVHAFLSGEAREVLHTFILDGSAGLARFAMPGCGHGACGQWRRRRRRLFCDFDSLFKE